MRSGIALLGRRHHGLERVEHPDVEMTEIVLVPGGDDEAVHTGRGGNHGVLDQFVDAALQLAHRNRRKE